MANCAIHKAIKLVSFCPACRGEVRSTRKAQTSRENGLLGGRPKTPAKSKRKPGAVKVRVV